jgi:hypothetical protein
VPENSALPDDSAAKDELPPILGSWRRIYIAVLVFLVLVIAGLGLFTAAFNQ